MITISVCDLLLREEARSLTVRRSWDSQECFVLKPCCLSERMEYLIKMLHNLGVDNVFENLATNCCEGDRMVIGCVGTVTFFVYGGNIGTPPG